MSSNSKRRRLTIWAVYIRCSQKRIQSPRALFLSALCFCLQHQQERRKSSLISTCPISIVRSFLPSNYCHLSGSVSLFLPFFGLNLSPRSHGRKNPTSCLLPVLPFWCPLISFPSPLHEVSGHLRQGKVCLPPPFLLCCGAGLAILYFRRGLELWYLLLIGSLFLLVWLFLTLGWFSITFAFDLYLIAEILRGFSIQVTLIVLDVESWAA